MYCCFLRRRRPQRSSRTDTLFPDTTLFRSGMLRTPQLRSALAEVCTGMNGTRFDFRIAPLTADDPALDPSMASCDLIMVEVDPKDAAEMALLHRLEIGRASCRERVCQYV